MRPKLSQPSIRRTWTWINKNSGGIQAILAVLGSVAIGLSIASYRQTRRSLDLQEASLVEARNAIGANRDQIREQQKEFGILQQEAASDGRASDDRYKETQKNTQRSLALTAGELKIATGSLKQSREIFDDQDRPWVSVIDGSFLPAEIGSPVVSLSIRADNNGHSPAINMHIAAEYKFAAEKEWASLVPGLLLELSRKSVTYEQGEISPGGTRGIILPIAGAAEDFQGVNSGARRLVVVGRIEYNDRKPHEVPHRTNFCLVVPSGTDVKQFGLCATGNSQE